MGLADNQWDRAFQAPSTDKCEVGRRDSARCSRRERSGVVAHLVRVDLVPHRDLLDRLVAAQCLQRYLRFELLCESPSFLNRVVGRFLSGRCGVLLSLTEQPPDDDTCESIGHDGKVSPRAEPFSSVQDLRNSDTVRILLLSRRPATDVSVFPPPNAQA